MLNSAALPAADVPAAPAKSTLSGLWLPVAFVLLYWAARLVMGYVDVPMFIRFMIPFAISAVMVLVVPIWWMFQKRISLRARFLGLGMAVVAGFAATQLNRDFMAPALLMTGLPIVFSVWVLWLFCAANARPLTVLVGSFVALSLSWAPFLLVRMEGLTGGVAPDLHWRWKPNSEQLFLAERAKRGAPKAPPAALAAPVKEQPGDWTSFRGPNCDGVVRGTHIATDWSANPPKQLWRQRTGPGWSSMSIVDGRLFTQEQRGDAEAVVCLDAATGNELWVHEEKTRYSDFQSGAGPRGTPSFSRGYVVALGANGALNCLDAATGAVKWSRNVVNDSGAKVPSWGVSGSPLIANDLVIVYAGDKSDTNLRAYRFDSGEPVWAAQSGEQSYVSPQPAVIRGVPQILHYANRGLISVEPATGRLLWQRDTPASGGVWRAVQPHVFGNSVLVSSDEFGTRMFDVSFDQGVWSSAERNYDLKLKAYFNDYAIHDGHVYGFDGQIFCCLDVQSGQRKWKAGRYGAGQMLLLADQALIVVLTERGEVVLLSATPEKHTELGKFEAIEGKTWNHPVLAHGRLYVRNGEEMACYEVEEILANSLEKPSK